MLPLMVSDPCSKQKPDRAAARSSHSAGRSALVLFVQVVSWTALVKLGLLTGATLGAASQYLVNG
jgi:hypothetical protein